MSTVDWVEYDPEGFPVGTIIEHHAPTCDVVPGQYVQATCSQSAELIYIPMTEVPNLGELPATGADLGGVVFLAVALVAAGSVAWAVDKVKRGWQVR